ncbi:hypothetical protein I7I50_07380 [Histoplasma capsulatum G186AR]|uniref:Uncharacterized protein n=1 Tax=Ajellomyces capsulatus TaxID=5037 RepID=A0A8H7YVK3_AJECA|nr:hypothetical protein I7I52_09548 [Histoplasma capsulatum]QSS68091.1 hypothetical protein I7I50_07380 [Histoplasma capsulatum G186AR]
MPARTFPSSSNQPIASPIASPEQEMCWRIVCHGGRVRGGKDPYARHRRYDISNFFCTSLLYETSLQPRQNKKRQKTARIRKKVRSV